MATAVSTTKKKKKEGKISGIEELWEFIKKGGTKRAVITDEGLKELFEKGLRARTERAEEEPEGGLPIPVKVVEEEFEVTEAGARKAMATKDELDAALSKMEAKAKPMKKKTKLG